jgi:hypothetical protein
MDYKSDYNLVIVCVDQSLNVVELIKHLSRLYYQHSSYYS